MIQSINIITAKAGMRQAILDELAQVVPLIRAEPGCREYAAGIDVRMPEEFYATSLGPDTFILMEKWKNLDTLQAHHGSAIMAEALSRVAPMVATRVAYFVSAA